MRVKCVSNNVDALRNPSVVERVSHRIHLEGSIEGLVLGKEYAVQAIERTDKETLVYLQLYDEDMYPTPWPIDFFQFSDTQPPSGWVTAVRDGRSLSTFAAWANDPTFYERLIDGRDVVAKDTYLQYRR